MPERTKTKGIGRGLSAILPTTSNSHVVEELREIPVELIVPNPNQPRQHFDSEALKFLANSLQESGVLQPVLVRPLPSGKYELIAGERRWRAAQMAQLPELPAVVRPDGDKASLELAVVENMARQDLNPVEEAQACALLAEDLGLTHEEVARKVGRSRTSVSNLIRLLDLPDEVLEYLVEGVLSEGHGRALLRCEDHLQRRQLAKEAIAYGWTVRELERQTNPKATVKGVAGGKEAKDFEAQAAAAELQAALAEHVDGAVKVKAGKDGFQIRVNFVNFEQAQRFLQLVSR